LMDRQLLLHKPFTLAHLLAEIEQLLS
jgi:hypothetical protein